MSQQTEIFANYELDNSRWKAIILKFLGGSILLHLVLLVAAIYVPAVRDAFYVAMLFSDVNAGWTNKDYEKTEIEEALVFDMPRDDRFRYPEGYFNTGEYVENPLDPTVLAVNGDPTLSGAVPPPPMAFDPTINPVPTPTPFSPPIYNPIPPSVNTPARRSRSKSGGLPALPNDNPDKKRDLIEEFNKAKSESENVAKATPTPSPEAVAKTSPTPETSDGAVKFNKKPWTDLGAKVVTMLDNKQLDLNQSAAVTIEGELDADGKLIAPKLINKSGDANLIAVANDFIGALNESGMLSQLKKLSEGSTKRKVVFNLSKDEKQMSLQVVSEIGDANRAKTLGSGFNVLFGGLVFASKEGSDERLMLENIKATSEKTQVVINWTMPTPTALELAKKKLAEVKAKPQSQTSSANTNAQANAEK